MTPSDYSNGSSLEHDRMQADVFEWLKNNPKFGDRWGERTSIKVERPIVVGGTLRAFVDIFEKWCVMEGGRDKEINVVLYEVKPLITSVGGLLRQMSAEAVLVSAEGKNRYPDWQIRTCPVVAEHDPSIPLLRRLYKGPVLLFNIQTRECEWA
jgi:hypothetical protein